MPHVAILQLFIGNGWIDSVAEQLVEIEEVQFIAVTAGRYNVVIGVYFDTYADLLAFYAALQSLAFAYLCQSAKLWPLGPLLCSRSAIVLCHLCITARSQLAQKVKAVYLALVPCSWHY